MAIPSPLLPPPHNATYYQPSPTVAKVVVESGADLFLIRTGRSFPFHSPQHKSHRLGTKTNKPERHEDRAVPMARSRAREGGHERCA